VSGAPAGHASDNAVRDGIIIATAGGLLASLLLDPVRSFIGSVWRLVTASPGAVWSVLTASVPVWAVLAVAAVVALVFRRVGRRRPVKEVYDSATRTVSPPRIEAPAPAVLSQLEDVIVRRLANEDGAWLGKGDLSDAARTTALRAEQALDRLEAAGLVEGHFSSVTGRSYGLTRRGRDFVIDRGYI